MTAPPQEFKEYTLTINLSVHPEMREKSLRDYIHSQIFTDNWIGAFRTNYILATEFQFRSRPLTSAAPLEGVFKDFDNNAVEWLKQHDTAIRKAEREKVLSPIKAVYDRFSHLDKILSARDPDCPMRQCYSDIWFVVKESLRREP